MGYLNELTDEQTPCCNDFLHDSLIKRSTPQGQPIDVSPPSYTYIMYSLSKSKLIAYRQCPKRLWLELHKPELRDDSRSQAAFKVGYQVGDIAQQVFDPDGIGVNVDPNDIGWKASEAATQTALQDGKGPVFEALLRIPGSLALADVMLPDFTSKELRWEMLEVKSSTGVHDYHRDDLAIQTYIAERNKIPLAKAAIAHINSQFVYPGDQDYEGLFHVEDLTEESKGRQTEVEQWIAEAQKTAALEDEPSVAVGEQCTSPFTCGFCQYCHQDLPQPEIPASILPRIPTAKLNDWANRGITELRDTPDSEINAMQQRVKAVTLSGETYFDAAAALARTGEQGAYTYFLDFETVNPFQLRAVVCFSRYSSDK